MRRALLSLLIGATLLAGIPAQAFWQSRDSNYNKSVTSAATYTGPGDEQSGATFYHGFQAYTAAYASAGSNSFNVRRASDNTTQNIAFLSTGAVNISAYNSFVGTDATATCSTSGSSTSLVCTGASSTPNSNDPISGTGITQPAYIISCGTFTAGAGTCTMNVAQNIAVAETVTFQVAGFSTEQYDQTTNGYNITQATTGIQMQVLPNCIGGQPCLLSLAATAQRMAGTFTAPAQPVTMTLVLEHYASFVQADALSLGGSVSLFFFGANTAGLFAGNALSQAATDGTPYISQGVVSTTVSAQYVNGSGSTGLNAGSSAPASPIELNTSSKPASDYIGVDAEWPAAATGTQITNVCHVLRIFWGTGGSC